MGKKKRARYHIELFFHYEKHYLLNNTITCALLMYLQISCQSQLYWLLFIHFNQFIPFSMYAKNFYQIILAKIIAQVIHIDTQ